MVKLRRDLGGLNQGCCTKNLMGIAPAMQNVNAVMESAAPDDGSAPFPLLEVGRTKLACGKGIDG